MFELELSNRPRVGRVEFSAWGRWLEAGFEDKFGKELLKFRF